MKPIDGRLHRAGCVGTYAGKALQVTARARQFASILLDDVGQVEKRVGFLPPETEGSQCFLEMLKRRLAMASHVG
jgi:hypothetical protein